MHHAWIHDPCDGNADSVRVLPISDVGLQSRSGGGQLSMLGLHKCVEGAAQCTSGITASDVRPDRCYAIRSCRRCGGGSTGESHALQHTRSRCVHVGTGSGRGSGLLLRTRCAGKARVSRNRTGDEGRRRWSSVRAHLRSETSEAARAVVQISWLWSTSGERRLVRGAWSERCTKLGRRLLQVEQTQGAEGRAGCEVWKVQGRQLRRGRSEIGGENPTRGSAATRRLDPELGRVARLP